MNNEYRIMNNEVVEPATLGCSLFDIHHSTFN